MTTTSTSATLMPAREDSAAAMLAVLKVARSTPDSDSVVVTMSVGLVVTGLTHSAGGTMGVRASRWRPAAAGGQKPLFSVATCALRAVMFAVAVLAADAAAKAAALAAARAVANAAICACMASAWAADTAVVWMLPAATVVALSVMAAMAPAPAPLKRIFSAKTGLAKPSLRFLSMISALATWIGLCAVSTRPVYTRLEPASESSVL